MGLSLKIPIAQFARPDLEEAVLTSVKTIMSTLSSDMGYRNLEMWIITGDGIVPMKQEGEKQERLQRKLNQILECIQLREPTMYLATEKEVSRESKLYQATKEVRESKLVICQPMES